MKSELTWLIGGPQGSGVESASNIFAHVCAKLGCHVFGKREFYSNIKGEHSYFTVRVSNEQIRSNVNYVDVMVSFDAETIFRHYDEIKTGGALIYDSDLQEKTIDEIPTINKLYKNRLKELLSSQNQTHDINGIISILKHNGVLLFPISFRTLLSNLSDNLENPRLKGMIRMFNVMGVSLSAGLLKIPSAELLDSIDKIFSKKPQIAEINKQAATFTYNFATANFSGFTQTLEVYDDNPNRLLLQGFQGTALGKIACGCRFQPYYPITPASDESNYLEANQIIENVDGSNDSIIVVQTEDEISAIGMTIGGALTGARSSTCTSGPGFSLMVEALGWAGINEVPIVITLYQRSGPSTGLPTRHGQDDLAFAVHAGHGEFPKLVYASGDVEESFYDTANCFNYSDIFQIPVIHLMDKNLASSVVTCEKFEMDKISINRGKLLDKIKNGDYKRFEITSDGISPRSKLGLENGVFWNTGDERDEYGHISEDPVIREKMMKKRMSKLELILEQIPSEEQIVSFGVSDYTIISWGSNKGAILDALDQLKQEGISVGFLHMKLLHPFPEKLVTSFLKDSKFIIDVESNYTGQLSNLFKQGTGRDIDYYILKYTGRPMTSSEIYDSVKKIINGTAKKREVLTHGA